MKILFIGGTGNISTSVSTLAVSQGVELCLLNRGLRAPAVPGTTLIRGDVATMRSNREVLSRTWDAVVNWIAYTEADVRRDIEVFSDKTGQYIFISSASAYQKPPTHPIITESTPLANPFWEYSRNKIACETRLMAEYRDRGFPVTIVRPSHTYDTVIPVAIGGWTEYTVIERIRSGRKIIVHGDGTSLWTITHAEDFAAGFMGLLGLPQSIGHAFHITSDEVLTWDQIHHAVADAVGCAPDIVHVPSEYLASLDEHLHGSLLGDKAHCAIFDNTKIKTFVPGFAAKIPFKDGIRRTLRWFEAEPARMVVRQSTHDFIDRVVGCFDWSGRSAAR
jgi:nucleoside-diphosphate-sugar epimerase